MGETENRGSPYTSIPSISLPNNDLQQNYQHKNPSYNFNRNNKHHQNNNRSHSPKILSRDIQREKQPIALDQLKAICQGRKEKIGEKTHVVQEKVANHVENSESNEYTNSSSKSAKNSGNNNNNYNYLEEKYQGNLLSWFKEQCEIENFERRKQKEKNQRIIKKCQAWENVDWDRIVNLK